MSFVQNHLLPSCCIASTVETGSEEMGGGAALEYVATNQSVVN